MGTKLKLSEIFKEDDIIVYHGTLTKFVNSIKEYGLTHKNYYEPNWFMVSTDFQSALFHATPQEGKDASVIEFKVPINNEKWFGYPYFWPPYKRNDNSMWFALKEPLGNELITKVHNVPYEVFLKRKYDGF